MHFTCTGRRSFALTANTSSGRLFRGREYEPNLPDAHHLVRGIVAALDLPLTFGNVFVEDSHDNAWVWSADVVTPHVERLLSELLG